MLIELRDDIGQSPLRIEAINAERASDDDRSFVGVRAAKCESDMVVPLSISKIMYFHFVKTHRTSHRGVIGSLFPASIHAQIHSHRSTILLACCIPFAPLSTSPNVHNILALSQRLNAHEVERGVVGSWTFVCEVPQQNRI